MQKGDHVNSSWCKRNSYLKNWKNGKVGISREMLKTVRSFPVLYYKSHKRFKEKDAVKKGIRWSCKNVGIIYLIILILTPLFYFLKYLINLS